MFYCLGTTFFKPYRIHPTVIKTINNISKCDARSQMRIYCCGYSNKKIRKTIWYTKPKNESKINV